MTTSTAFRQDIADAVFSLPVATALAFTFTGIGDGRAEGRLPWREDHSHAPGAFQAGPITSLADFVGAAAAATHLPVGTHVITTDLAVKFLTEARGAVLVARARILRPGRRTSVAAVDLTVDDGTELCATALLTVTNHSPA